MKVKVIQVKVTGKGISQFEYIHEDILSITNIGDDIMMITQYGETGSILNISQKEITRIEILP